MKKLRVLELDGNQISDVSALTNLPLLSDLDLKNNPIKDAGGLATTRGLKIKI